MSGDRKNNLQKKKTFINAFQVRDVKTVMDLACDLPENAKKTISKIVLDSKNNSMECAPLMAAIKHGNYHFCKLLIEVGFATNVKNEPCLLKLALKGRQPEIIKLLIDSGADVNNTNIEDSSSYPIFEAIHYGNSPSVIEQIILAGFPVDKTDICGLKISALHNAVIDNNIEIVNVLVEHKANLNALTFTGESALTLAIDNNYCDMVKLLVNKGADLHNKETVMCPLFVAIRKENLTMIELVLELGASIKEGWYEGETMAPLLYAAIYDHSNVKLVTLLIEKGAEINVTIEPGNPLFEKASNKFCRYPENAPSLKSKVGKALPEKWADDKIECDGFTPLDFAFFGVKLDLCRLLIREGANLSNRQINLISLQKSLHCPELIKLCLEYGRDFRCYYHGRTLYHHILTHRDPDIIKLFWYHEYPFDQVLVISDKDIKVDPVIKNMNIFKTQSKFIFGIKNNDVEMVRSALDKGAEPRGCSVKIPSTLHYVAARGQHEIAWLLLESGVPANSVKKRETPLNTAVKKNDVDMCCILLQFGACYNFQKTGKSKVKKTQEKECKELNSLFKIIHHLFKMAKEGNVRLLMYLEHCVNTGNIGLLKVLMNCVNRQGMSLSETALVFSHTELFKDIMFLKIKHI